MLVSHSPLAALVLLAACSSVPPVGQEVPRGLPDAPRVAWTVDGGGFDAPAQGADSLCIAGNALKCIDPESGEVLATRPAPDGTIWVHVESLASGDWLASTYQEVVRLSPQLDRVRWRSEAGPAGAFRVAGGLVAVVLDRGIRAVDLETGAVRWERSYGGKIQMRPATDGSRFLFGTTSGSMLAVSCADGSVLWRNEQPTKYGWSDPVVADDLVLVADRGVGGSMRPGDTGRSSDDVEGPRAGALNAFRIVDGERVWSTIFGATGFSQPFVEEGTGLVWAGFGTTVVPFELATGELLLDRAIRSGRNPFGSPRPVGDRVAFGNLDGHFYVHERDGGALLWALACGGQAYSWSMRDGSVFLQTSGRLVCLRQDPKAERVARGTILELDSGSMRVAEAPARAPRSAVRASAPRARPERVRWIQDLHALGTKGEERRTEALAAIRDALESDAASRRQEALAALQGCGDVEFDKLSFRPRVVALAGQGEEENRLAALGALIALGTEPSDLALVLDTYPLLHGRERARIAWYLAVFTGHDLRQGRPAEILLELARDPRGTGFDRQMNGVWGCRVSDEATDAFLELSRSPDPELAHSAIYFGLSTFEDKNAACVDRLIELLADPNPENSSRAVWGLGHGVPEALEPRVVDALLDFYEHRAASAGRQMASQILRAYGAGDRLDALTDG